jgi:hypothetical protein
MDILIVAVAATLGTFIGAVANRWLVRGIGALVGVALVAIWVLTNRTDVQEGTFMEGVLLLGLIGGGLVLLPLGGGLLLGTLLRRLRSGT